MRLRYINVMLQPYRRFIPFQVVEKLKKLAVLDGISMRTI